MQATLDGLTFESGPAAATARYSIDPDGLKNWFDGLEMRRETLMRPDAHGAYDLPGYLSPRAPSLRGTVRGSSESDLQDAIDDLMGALADGGSGTFGVTFGGRTLSAAVRRQGKPEINILNPRSAARYRLELWAADPRRYGTAHTFGPGASVGSIEHDGNFGALGKYTVTGSSGSGYTLDGPDGREVIVVAPLVSGTPHVIDFAKGGLYIGGTRVMGGISKYVPWVVPKGSAITVSVTAGAVEVEVKDTFS